MTLPVIGLPEIRAAATQQLIIDSVRGALIAHAEGRTSVPSPLHLAFPDAGGDCHVKAGHVTGSPHFTVKVASGFYRNPQLGLPTNSGVMLVMDAKTGQPVAVLADGGWLTAWRTAAAGALITHALTAADVQDVAVLGAGLQARLQIEWLHFLRPLAVVKVWGRNAEAAERLSAQLRDSGINAHPASLEEATRSACVITATAATAPLAPAEDFDAANHVTAIGADMPGKKELPPALFRRAATIATDDHIQCLEHGDFGNAVRAGCSAPDADMAVGTILRDGTSTQAAFSIADLTGIGAADATVAVAVLKAVGIPRTG
jgi:ornithine cyclodeaminase/alanine dehydrogenase-like protein (mu-crystallin family)